MTPSRTIPIASAVQQGMDPRDRVPRRRLIHRRGHRGILDTIYFYTM